MKRREKLPAMCWNDLEECEVGLLEVDRGDTLVVKPTFYEKLIHVLTSMLLKVSECVKLVLCLVGTIGIIRQFCCARRVSTRTAVVQKQSAHSLAECTEPSLCRLGYRRARRYTSQKLRRNAIAFLFFVRMGSTVAGGVPQYLKHNPWNWCTWAYRQARREESSHTRGGVSGTHYHGTFTQL